MINTNPNHKHTYDEHGNMTCCSLEEKIYAVTEGQDLSNQTHQHAGKATAGIDLRPYLPASISFVLLLAGIVADNFIRITFFQGYVRLIWFAISYLPVGWPVMKDAIKAFKKSEVFTEFFLMSIATLGAFYIGQYPEGVAVMLFYAVGELFQSAAVNRAKRNIKALLDIRPDIAIVKRNNQFISVKPETVSIGEVILVKAGEKVPLDGKMLSEKSSFNTAALTGESKPKIIEVGEDVLAGMLNLDKVVEIKVAKKFTDSSIARILELVQNATSRKAKTELFIRKFAKIYTPIVSGLAVALTFVPFIFVQEYIFNEWLYRALIFLVISCPCALVVSIPLGYFGGIGAASRNGILFKGSNYLELMTKVNTVVMDKTGTLTKGVFKVQKVETPLDKDEFIQLVAALEKNSTHPIAKAIADYAETSSLQAANVEEIPGHGLRGEVKGKQVLAGNTRLLLRFGIAYDKSIDAITDTVVVTAIDGNYSGYITIADEIKEDAELAVKSMHENGVGQIVMLSGDKTSIVQQIAAFLGIDSAFGDLLPEQKVQKVEEIKKDQLKVVAFVGDGINDAPVLALSDVGIAMGGLGSDAAIETADVVIQTDQPSKIATAIKIGKATNKVVWQNIAFAFGVKIIVLALGAGGLATMWEAVFADVGVALLAIFNAVRIQRMRF
ncbi:MAG: cadmium-translocating P-type ATPase [Cyclobacteriaceae bacterium]|nr:cadmium-translocating P-type ATPase [Cyclobacteriaceae bacterium]